MDDTYEKLRRNIGNDFRVEQGARNGKIELYSFNCSNCGYRNIHNLKILRCGCAKELTGTLVYCKIGDTVIYDTREKRKGRLRG
jgi:hypothetical protein